MPSFPTSGDVVHNKEALGAVHIYIGRFCVFVCLSRKMITLPNGLKSSSTSSSRSVFMVFHGSRLVFHGSRLVLHGSRLIFMVFQVPGWFFMVPARVSCFFMVSG